jgi:stage II sporulation protein D
VQPVVEVRDVRVLVASGTEPLRFHVNGPYAIRTGGGSTSQQAKRRGWTEVAYRGEGLSIGGRIMDPRRVEIVPARGAIFELSSRKGDNWTPATRYGGRLTFLLEPGGRMLAINSVDVETYLTGVLTRELYPDFHPEAYRAQAVAARTYVLYQMSRKADRDYDVTATEASQVYGGLAEGRGARRAIEAVRYTRGIVCTWTSPAGERIFCTYYSSACGGMTQNVANCKPVPSIPPLAGGVRCNYCRIARGQAYRWGPVRLSKRDVTDRLVSRYPGLAELGAIRAVEVARKTRHGRAVRIRLVGSTGRAKELVAEDFRLAVGSRTMRSTDCRITDAGDAILLTDGRGFGHGMGLCQWGMQGQALAGRKAGEILKFYYPGAHLTRAY